MPLSPASQPARLPASHPSPASWPSGTCLFGTFHCDVFADAYRLSSPSISAQGLYVCIDSLSHRESVESASLSDPPSFTRRGFSELCTGLLPAAPSLDTGHLNEVRNSPVCTQ
eukprot:8334000-Heterocapsa_arctica.AAC.1